MQAIWTKVLKPGEKWSGAIGRGKYVHFKAQGAGANVSVLLYNLLDKTERYNMPDTLKAQFTAHLTQGNILMSDNGRAMASIVQDSLGWHDSICGLTTRELTDEKWGKTTYQEQRNDYHRAGMENVAMELVRNGLSMRDLVPCVNLFSKVFIKEDGSMNFEPDWCKEGDTVTLRTEMDCIWILSNTPNPLDDSPEWPSVPVEVSVYDAPATDLTDECVQHRDENFRAFQNTWDYYNLLGM